MQHRELDYVIAHATTKGDEERAGKLKRHIDSVRYRLETMKDEWIMKLATAKDGLNNASKCVLTEATINKMMEVVHDDACVVVMKV
jgi:hypothetical protein